jgi:2-C-methyl-D-erythritol 4-phosphate cytidylyltransferase
MTPTATTQPIPTCAAVIVAAGRSERFGGSIPKQFVLLAGRPLFAYSLRLLAGLPFVSELVLVVPLGEGLPPRCSAELDDLNREIKIVEGGAVRRQDSVANGLAALAAPYQVALIHDAARPFPDPVAVAELARRAADCGGGLLAAPSPDTVKRAGPDRFVARTLDREGIWLAQTPQAIRADHVARAVQELRRPDLDLTDEAALLESWGVSVALIQSTIHNFKITHPADLALAEAMLQRR